MRIDTSKWRFAAFCCAALLTHCGPSNAADTFRNSNLILINNNAPADPYPSGIVVSNLVGEITGVTLTLSNFTHGYPLDLEVLLVSPGGRTCLVMSHVGGFEPVAAVTLIFDDAALAFVSDKMSSGVFRPTVSERQDSNYLLVPPAPAAPYDYDLAALSGSEPNGTWKLFLVDTDNEDSGMIADGWALSIDTAVRLQIRAALDELEISWASNVPEAYVLQSSPRVSDGEWTDVPQLPLASGNRRIVHVSVPSAPRFFRLSKND